jgi:hypothetical protein
MNSQAHVRFAHRTCRALRGALHDPTASRQDSYKQHELGTVDDVPAGSDQLQSATDTLERAPRLFPSEAGRPTIRSRPSQASQSHMRHANRSQNGFERGGGPMEISQSRYST